MNIQGVPDNQQAPRRGSAVRRPSLLEKASYETVSSEAEKDDEKLLQNNTGFFGKRSVRIGLFVLVPVVALSIFLGVYFSQNASARHKVSVTHVVISSNGNPQANADAELLILEGQSAAQVTLYNIRNGLNIRTQLYNGYKFVYYGFGNSSDYTLSSCSPEASISDFWNGISEEVESDGDNFYFTSGSTISSSNLVYKNGDGQQLTISEITSHDDAASAPSVNFSPSPVGVDVAQCTGRLIPNPNPTSSKIRRRMMAGEKIQTTANANCAGRTKVSVREEWYWNWKLSLLAYNNVNEAIYSTGGSVPSNDCNLEYTTFTTASTTLEGLPTSLAGIVDPRPATWGCYLTAGSLSGNACVASTNLQSTSDSSTWYASTCQSYQNSATSSWTGNAGVYNFVIVKKATDPSTTCYISMRGSYSLYDWLADMQSVTPTIWTVGGVNYRVANGFYQFYMAIQSDVRNALTAQGCTAVKITGHSLGGALADAVALDLYANPLTVSGTTVSVQQIITFGQPRFFMHVSSGDPSPPTALQNIKTRIVGYDDPVPMLPFIMTDSQSTTTAVITGVADVSSAIQSALGTGAQSPSSSSISASYTQNIGAVHYGKAYANWDGFNWQDGGSLLSNYPDMTNFNNGGSGVNGGESWFYSYWTCWYESCQLTLLVGYIAANILDHLEYDETVCQSSSSNP